MATFPILKTNAVAQYPATRRLEFRNQILRFVDGGEQRYRDCASPLHQWEIRLDQLDEGEAAAIEEFFVANQGTFGTFGFTDPWDGRVYENCSLEFDSLEMTTVAEMWGRTVIRVRENRG